MGLAPRVRYAFDRGAVQLAKIKMFLTDMD